MVEDFDADARYQLPSGRVVEVVGELNGYLTLQEACGGQVFDVETADFVAQLQGGYIQPVELHWKPVAAD